MKAYSDFDLRFDRLTLKEIMAWEVRPEGEDYESIWNKECVIAALHAGQDIELVTPVLRDEVGGWRYEQFKKRGCEHCKNKAEAIILRLKPMGEGQYCLEDGAGYRLIGLRNLDRRNAPIRIPKIFSAMPIQEAEAVRQAIRAGYAKPVFEGRG